MDDKITNPGAPLPGPATSGRDGSPSSLGLSRPDITPDKIAETVARLMSERWCTQDADGKLWADDTPLDAADLLEALARDLAAARDRAEKAEAERDDARDRRDTWMDRCMNETSLRLAAEVDRDRLAAELAEARTFLREFAASKIDPLPSPHYRSPEDEPDPVVDATTVWAWQTDARALAKGDTP